MQRLLVTLVVAAVAVTFVAAAAAATVAGTASVAVVDDRYDDGDPPRNVTSVAVGDTVVWSWGSGNRNPHTVSSVTGLFDSDGRCAGDPAPCRAPGTTLRVTFDRPGTFEYRCKVHLTMAGIVEVVPAEEPPAPPSEPPADPRPSESPTGGGGQSPEPSRPPVLTRSSPSEPPPPPSRAAPRLGVSRGRALPGFRVETGGAAPLVPDQSLPQVADPLQPQPTFSPFPTAPPLSAEGMAVEVPGRWPRVPRGLAVGIAVTSVLATWRMISRVVLGGL